ncbi:MAG: hypothetical protein M0Z67_02020 [Nitrospiraceae bacterium]|nr:hypothetical protein [Nitrospiraceae bacterium]
MTGFFGGASTMAVFHHISPRLDIFFETETLCWFVIPACPVSSATRRGEDHSEEGFPLSGNDRAKRLAQE